LLGIALVDEGGHQQLQLNSKELDNLPDGAKKSSEVLVNRK
jgi:hypothetical protein